MGRTGIGTRKADPERVFGDIIQSGLPERIVNDAVGSSGIKQSIPTANHCLPVATQIPSQADARLEIQIIRIEFLSLREGRIGSHGTGQGLIVVTHAIVDGYIFQDLPLVLSKESVFVGREFNAW